MLTVDEIKALAEKKAADEAKAAADAAAKAKTDADAKAAAAATEKPRAAEAAVLDEVAAQKKKLGELSLFVGFDTPPAPPPGKTAPRPFFDPFGALADG